jgi:hypothetical protein|tara:strand:+ start:79 stop:246 length:168 start_codon:yes stop_codon:yes gene_type:complete
MNITNASAIIIENSKAEELALIWLAIMLLCCISGCYYTIKCETGPKLIHKIHPYK